jgi:Phosphodiester glycosidase
LGKGATRETDPVYDDEPFAQLVQRQGAAVVAGGSFFNTSTNELYGNMIATGQFLRYRDWENRGTVLLLGEGNRPEMLSAGDAAAKTWDRYWFYLTAGPRLLRAGDVALNPAAEGFQNFSVQPAARAAIGFSADLRTLYLVHPLQDVSLNQLANLMKAIGCHEAMNLDGGASRALAINGAVKLAAGRNLAHALVVYDASRPAPAPIRTAWDSFQAGDRRPSIPVNPPINPPVNPPVSGLTINQRISQSLAALGKFSTLSFRATPTSDPGDNSCGWAVNRVLTNAGIQPLSNLVRDSEDMLKQGRGTLITDHRQAQAGDIVIAPNTGHMGIAILVNRVIKVRSSSAKRDIFDWDSSLNFDGQLGAGNSRVYRLTS